LFSDKVADQLFAQAIRVYQANLRQGTSYTKTRSEVKRTKKKWYKQKGTGNARHGARTPNIFVGGGVSHGPRAIENWSLKLNRKSKLIALQQALTLQKKNLFVSKDIATLKGKTKGADKLISKFSEKTDKVLVILHKMNETVLRALANLNNVDVTTAERLNVLQVAQADKILIDFSALKTLEDRFNKVKKKSIKK
jgi:large subunit ribosomal protein L4